MALNNASLNGTYAHLSRNSDFDGADPNGGFGMIDIERAFSGEITFDGAGTCSVTESGDIIERTIGETFFFSNLFTTTHTPVAAYTAPCTYNVAIDGVLTMTIYPGTPEEHTVTGILGADGNTLMVSHVEAVPGSYFGTVIGIAVKKGTGMTNASLNGTYAFVYKGSAFWGGDANGGFGTTDEAALIETTISFDGAGSCTGSESNNGIQRRIDETPAFSNTFVTTHTQTPPVALPPCIYSVAGDGSITITFDPGGPNEEVVTGARMSADGGTVIMAAVEAIPGDVFSAGLVVAVKKGTAMNNASVRGSYSLVNQSSAFIDNDINNGFGMTDIEGVGTGEFTFDGAGGCTSYPSPEDAILRTIGETGTFSNTFTTLHTQTAFGPQFCVYDVSPDGTMTLTFEAGTPDEEIFTAAVREDGNMTILSVVDIFPDWMGVNLAMLVRSARPAADIKANGSDGAITITRADTLNVTVSLEPGNLGVTNADWWALADTPIGWYRYNVGTNSWVPGQAVTYQGPVRDLPAREVLNMTGLPAGVYTLSFEVDLTRNGVKDAPIYSDSVGVSVAP